MDWLQSEVITETRTDYIITEGILRRYLWWRLRTLYLHACRVRVPIGDSGLCCYACVMYFECKSTPLLVDSAWTLGLVLFQICWWWFWCKKKKKERKKERRTLARARLHFGCCTLIFEPHNDKHRSMRAMHVQTWILCFFCLGIPLFVGGGGGGWLEGQQQKSLSV